MSRYPSQAQSSATNRGQVGQRGAATPTTNPWPPALTLKLGDVVRLVYGVDDEFTAGQIVYITGFYDTLSSPTQPGDWVRTDANVLYSFAKMVPLEEILWYNGPQTGREGAPKHEEVTLQPDAMSKSDALYEPGDRVYLQKTIPITYKPLGSRRVFPALQAGPGIRCFISKAVTRIDDKSSNPGAITASSIKKKYYAVKVKVSLWHWQDVRQNWRKERLNFELLSITEKQSQYYSARKLPNGGNFKVVSVGDGDRYRI